MKILIIGANGQLGSDCKQVFSLKHEIFCTSHNDLDITRPKSVKKTIDQVKPDVIINCAAYTHVDRCEIEKDLAWQVNVNGPENLAKSAKKSKSLLIHISTDYVFDGKRPQPLPYVEKDKTSPMSFYGKTKWNGEEAIRKITDQHIILRTSWLYGIIGNNFLKTILKLALDNPKRQIKVVNDQFGSLTWSFRVAMQINMLLKHRGQGTYHVTSDGYSTWYEGAVYFLNKIGCKHNLIPCTTEEYPTEAARPKNSILENKRLKENGINIMPDWKQDIDEFVTVFKNKRLFPLSC
ncbi:dTDP-4-dehydrorhamnose reductase [Candidatus Magnetomoraceae bacterium gMMP-15]